MCKFKSEAGCIHHAIKIIFVGEILGEQGEFMKDEIAETKWFTPEEIENMGPETLRDVDIKQMVKDYFAGKRYPLDMITHTVVQ